MIPVQKVLNIYKSSMDLKDKGNSNNFIYRELTAMGNKNTYSDKDKNSFRAILKKELEK